MNNFQICTNSLDATPLYLPQQLFLKPTARLNISIQLPTKTVGKSISNWEVMDSLRNMIKPDKFCSLKATKTNVEFLRFEAEMDDRSKLNMTIEKLNHRTIKLKEFPELLKIRASLAKSSFPTQHEWDTFFRDSKDMNEMKPGERPDTIHISNLPIKWFVSYHIRDEDNLKPSEKIFYRVFEKYGHIRRVDIPICDPYRNKMKADVSGMQVFDFKEPHFFEGYVQFKDYIGFSKAMSALRDMKLLNKSSGEMYMVNISVDFDRTKHLSDANVRRREIVRDRLVKKEVLREEKERNQMEEEEAKLKEERQKEIDKKNAKEQRRKQREENRKKKMLDKLKVTETHDLNDKIAKEEKKLLRVQRKLEAIRLVEELFRRIQSKKKKDVTANKNDNGSELTRFKNLSELEVLQQQEKLHRIIEGRVVLKSILADTPNTYADSSSSDSSKNNKTRQKNSTTEIQQVLQNAALPVPLADWYGYSYPYMPAVFPQSGIPNLPYIPRGRGRYNNPSTSRGFPRSRPPPRYRGHFRRRYGLPPEMQDEYYKYFEKFSHEHDNRRNRSKSRSRCSRSYSKRSRSYSHSRSRSHSRKRSRSHSSRSRYTPFSKHGSSRRKSRSRSPSSKSVDSSKFISPSRLRLSRSRSWSMPKDGSKGKRSWSKSPCSKK